jgi:pyruvate carboxylase subunit B
MVLGYLGKTPLPPDPEVVELASRELKLPRTEADPMSLADGNPAASLRAVAAVLGERGIAQDEESLAIAAICGEKGLLFLEGKANLSLALAAQPADGRRGGEPLQTGPESRGDRRTGTLEASGDYTVILDDRAYGVRFSGEGLTVDGVSYAYSVLDGLDEALLSRQASSSGLPADIRAESREIRAPMPGMIVRINKRKGDKVAVGETVLVLETMASEIPVNSRISGVVVELAAAWGDRVEAGQPLLRLSVMTQGGLDAVSKAEDGRLRSGGTGDTVIVESPIAGLVLRIYKAPGERVLAGESILVVESLKMERPVNSPVEGVIESIRVKQGDMMGKNQSIAAIVRKGVGS